MLKIAWLVPQACVSPVLPSSDGGLQEVSKTLDHSWQQCHDYPTAIGPFFPYPALPHTPHLPRTI